jgi:spermidine/putrescine transport system ATP-binding protein
VSFENQQFTELDFIIYKLMSDPILQISEIEKSFEGKKVLSGITFDIFSGEILALLGPSGCGKSTLLAIIAGIENPEQGKVTWYGAQINNLPPHLRGFGLMFQEDLLFPHLNVFENIAFGLRMEQMDHDYIQAKVLESLAMVGLQGFEDRNVNTLSGGEQQRVALARSIAPQPGLLMLDEPLSSLDRNLREHLLEEIKKLLKELNQTAIYVTHDQEEAFSIADRIVLMQEGRVVQTGTPEELYNHPKNKFVANFLGLSNLIQGTVKHINNQFFIESAIGNLATDENLEGGNITLLVKPNAIQINGSHGMKLSGIVINKVFQGNFCQIIIDTNEIKLKFVLLINEKIPEINEEIQFSIDPKGIIPISEMEPDFK